MYIGRFHFSQDRETVSVHRNVVWIKQYAFHIVQTYGSFHTDLMNEVLIYLDDLHVISDTFQRHF